MNLRPRFLLLTAVFLLVVALPSWWVVRSLVDDIIETWAVRYAEKQVLYDKSRTLQPILREVALSRQLAQSKAVVDWARNPDDARLLSAAIQEMERFRLNFANKNYFAAARQNGRYYYNNATNEFEGPQFRYVLDPGAAKDAWFFDLIRQGRDLHINVNPDVNLGITQLWMDVLIRDGDEILGMVGTGLELTRFIDDVVEEHTAGITSLFVDHAGAIQVHRNQQFIDFGSLSKRRAVQSTVRLLFDRDTDHLRIARAMETLRSSEQKVVTEFVVLDGKRHLAGVTYLPEIDWYEITLLDLEVLVPLSQFAGVMSLFFSTLLGLSLLFLVAITYYVIQPLQRLQSAMGMGANVNGHVPISVDSTSGEMCGVFERFAEMTHRMAEKRMTLEQQLQSREQALERLKYTDPLTGLLNRQGMVRRLHECLEHSVQDSTSLGLLWVEVDHFKTLNALHGHTMGDAVLVEIARIIRQLLGDDAVAARWGGDEFLLAIPGWDQARLDGLGQRLRRDVAASDQLADRQGLLMTLNVSVGGHLKQEGEGFDAMLERLSAALSLAKQRGGNVYCSSVEVK